MSFIIFPGVITPPLTPGAVPYGTGSNVLMNAQGTSGQVLISGGANAPTWANAAPSTQELAGGVAGDLPYQQAPSDTTFLNLVSGGLLYGGASAPAYLANVQGGVLYGGATDPAYLVAGTAGQVLQSNGTSAPTWTTDIGGNAANVTGTVAVANGGTGLATLTADNVILGDGTNNVKFVAPGSSGNVLVSNGTTWTSAAPGGGGSLILVTSVSGTNTSQVDLTTGLTATYRFYKLYVSFTDAFQRDLRVRFFINGVVNTASAYFRTISLGSGGGANWNNTNSSGQSILSFGATSNQTMNVEYTIFDPTATTRPPVYYVLGANSASSNGYVEYGLQGLDVGQSGALTGFRFTFSGSSVNTFEARLYGIKP